MNNGSVVTTRIALIFVPLQGRTRSLESSFCYTKDAPYTVRVDFHAGFAEPVTWIFGRELLSAGIDGPQGLGDVRIWPSAPGKAGVRGADLNIELRSPDGRAVFKAPLSKVEDFVRRTYGLVPAGQEDRYTDFDAGLTELLREVP